MSILPQPWLGSIKSELRSRLRGRGGWRVLWLSLDFFSKAQMQRIDEKLAAKTQEDSAAGCVGDNEMP